MSHLGPHPDEHFDEATVLLHIEGELDAASSRALTAHASTCAACRSLLHALQRENLWLRESLLAAEEPLPRRLLMAAERTPVSSGVPWASIAAVAVSIAGVSTLSSFLDAWSNAAAQAGFSQTNLIIALLFSGAFWEGWSTVQNFLNLFVLAATGITLLWLLPRQWRRFVGFGGVVCAIAIVLAMPASSHAADIRHGKPNFTLPAGETVATDLIVTGERTTIDGDVNGDLIALSKNITVSGHIKGDVIAFGQEIRVDGPVDGNIRVFAQSFMLNGIVGKNLMVWASDMQTDPRSQVGGTVTVGSSNAQLGGRAAGDLLALTRVLDIEGSLGHDAAIWGNRLSIGSQAQIAGETKFTGQQQPEVATGAKLAQPLEFTLGKPLVRERVRSRASYFWRQFLLWAASLIFGIVLLWLVPKFFSETVDTLSNAGPAIGFGLLFLIATPIAVVIACLTIVGLSVGITALLLYLLALYAAQMFVGSWIGGKLLGATAEIGPAIGRLALGLGILRVLRIIPCIGRWVAFLMVIWGLGALLLALYKRIAHRPAVATA